MSKQNIYNELKERLFRNNSLSLHTKKAHLLAGYVTS